MQRNFSAAIEKGLGTLATCREMLNSSDEADSEVL